jgi:hypothetical protein
MHISLRLSYTSNHNSQDEDGPLTPRGQSAPSTCVAASTTNNEADAVRTICQGEDHEHLNKATQILLVPMMAKITGLPPNLEVDVIQLSEYQLDSF